MCRIPSHTQVSIPKDLCLGMAVSSRIFQGELLRLLLIGTGSFFDSVSVLEEKQQEETGVRGEKGEGRIETAGASPLKTGGCSRQSCSLDCRSTSLPPNSAACSAVL